MKKEFNLANVMKREQKQMQEKHNKLLKQEKKEFNHSPRAGFCVKDKEPDNFIPKSSSSGSEFNLSEKIQAQLIYICALRYDKDCDAEQFAEATDKVEEDIKEFIRQESLLLLNFHIGVINWIEFLEKRNKLAGKNLI